MSHMLLILEPHGQRAARTEAEGRAAYDSMLAFAAGLKARGLLKAAESLRADTDAVRVRTGAGRSQMLDGPFTEAKEMIGGFFLLDGVTREEAIAIARECPAAQWATVEVRSLGPCFA
ncbi:dehydrogenase [Rhodoferax koreense]|uniref:Dehydrogenase n=1 Tax=Rhodoferax koreensis TaxID=1842727 RepID=A0A1P8JS14_9BURK|nr:YciI family protein [Rhodoferax koreense]APW36553.1 dehydrogenase [Rhodoferax koreense]